MSLAASFRVRKAAFRSLPDRINERRHVPATKVREIAAMLKAIHASEDIVAACEKAIRVIEKLRALQLTKAVELAEAAVEESLTYYAFPEENWRRICTTDVFDKPSLTSRRITVFSLSGLPAAPP